MLRYAKITSASFKKLRLLDIFRLTMADVNAMKEDNHEDDVWGRIAPDGGLYRLNALEAEHLKHQEDLHSQFEELVEELDFLLEPALEEQNKGEPKPEKSPSNLSPKYRLLLEALRKAQVQDEEKDTENGAIKKGFVPLTEFLHSEGVVRLFGGLVLLPADRKMRQRSMKNKLFALLVMAVQVCSPVMVLWNSLKDKGVQVNYIVNFPQRFGTPQAILHEVMCLGSTTKLITTVLGALFLLMFIEITRAYCHEEVRSAVKTRLVPVDSTWRTMGQLVNMWCIFWSVAAMPIIFFEEHNVKDIVFDSLGIIFIFTLDDLSGDALGYLKLDDETFQQMSGWTMGALIQCPIRIRDIVNTQAGRLKDIFQISIGPEGLRAAAGPNRGKPCLTRLMEDSSEADENTPLASKSSKSFYLLHKLQSDHHNILPYQAHLFKYCVQNADSTGEPVMVTLNTHQTTFLMLLWNLLSLLLMFAEITLPILFIVMYNPCKM